MNLRRLRSFTTVARTLHFGRAAEELHIAQPALTQQIQQLELELGAQLLERDRRSVRLTTVGALFLVEAGKIIEQVERARLVATRAGRGELGHIEIGHVGSIAYSGVLAQAVIAFRKETPDATLALSEQDLEPQIAHLIDGRIDVAFIRLPAGPLQEGLETYTLSQEPVLVCLRHNDPLAAQPIKVRNLAERPFLVTHLREGYGFYDTMLKTCAQAGFSPDIASRSRQFATIVSLVAAGNGVALVPGSISRLNVPDVVYRPLADCDVSSDVAIAYRTDEAAPAVLRFIMLCKSMSSAGDGFGSSAA